MRHGRAFTTIGLLIAAVTIGASPTNAQGRLIFDQGPESGDLGVCNTNQASGQNWADQVVFPEGAIVEAIDIFTNISVDPGLTEVHVRIRADDGAGNPGAIVYEEDRLLDVVEPVGEGLFRAYLELSVPFEAAPGETFWYGVSGTPPWNLGQCMVLSPGDGRIAEFDGTELVDHPAIGDQMFALSGGLVPVELQSFAVE